MAYDRVVQYGGSWNRVGVSNMQGLTLFEDVGQPPSPMAEAEGQQVQAAQGSPHLWLAALLVFVAAWWLASQHLAFGPANVIFMAFAVVAVIVLAKTVFGRFYVPGLSPVLLAA